MSPTSHPVRRGRPTGVGLRASHLFPPAPSSPPVLPVPDRPNRRRRPENASWACFWSVDLLSRRFAADVLLPLTIVLLLVAAVIGAVGLTYVAR